MTIAERTILNQRKAIQQANNARFDIGEWEYKLEYDGGLAEFFNIYGRRKGETAFKYINGFMGYKLHNREQVIALAKGLVEKNSKS